MNAVIGRVAHKKIEVINLNQNHQIISNQSDKTMFKEITQSMKGCESFIFNVAFISFGGIQLLLNSLDEARSNDIPGKILTSDYLDFTEPKALRKLKKATAEDVIDRYNELTK
jgi:HKD family nuclease